MNDSLTTFRSCLRRLFRLSLWAAFLLSMAGSILYHRVEDKTGLVKPFGVFVFYFALIPLSVGLLIHSGSLIRSAAIKGTGRGIIRSRREFWGWVVMCVAVIMMIGSSASIGSTYQSTLFQNVPSNYVLVTVTPDSETTELHFRPGWVFRSPFRKSFLIPQGPWNAQFAPEFRDNQGAAISLQLTFCCSVDQDNADKFGGAFAESFKGMARGQSVQDALFVPVNLAYERTLKVDLANREFRSLDEMQRALDEALQLNFTQSGLKISKVKLIPVQALPPQPVVPQLKGPFV